MANNNLKNFENALSNIDMGNLKITYDIGKNPNQVTRLYVWDEGKKIIDKSVSAVTRQNNFEELLKDIKNNNFCADISTTCYNLDKGELIDGLEDESVFDNEWHKSHLTTFKALLLDRIKEGEEVNKVIEKYLTFYNLSDFTLNNQLESLKKFHKVIKLSNNKYYTDDQLKMVYEVIQTFKRG